MSLFQWCVFACAWVCVCLAVSLSTFVHKRRLIFQCTTTMFSSCSPYKQTHPCLQMKTNIDEIKLGKEYLISELNVWIKLGFLYWIKPVSIGSMSSIWENREGKTFSVFCALLFFCFIYFLFTFLSPSLCHFRVLGYITVYKSQPKDLLKYSLLANIQSYINITGRASVDKCRYMNIL